MKIIGLSVLLMAFTVTIVSAQDTNVVLTTNNIPGIGEVSNDPIPTSKEDFWKWAIAVVVPALVMGLKKMAPRIPTWVLPLTTPFLGLLLGFGLKSLAGLNWGWVDMTQAGTMAVFVREAWNQVVSKQIEARRSQS